MSSPLSARTPQRKRQPDYADRRKRFSEKLGKKGRYNGPTRHNPGLGMMQSIFSPAARRQDTQIMRGALRRDGGLKMDWTKPLHWRAMGIESAVVSTKKLETAAIS
jgi:hypothetical protein